MHAQPLPNGTTHSVKLSDLFAGILVMGILVNPCRAQESSAQIMQDAKTAGAASATAIQSAIANTTNTPLPSISSSNLTQQGQNQAAACQATTSAGTPNPQCDAINTAQSDAALRTSLGQPVTASDPSVRAAQTVIRQPNNEIGTFDTATSPCSTAALTTPSGQPTTEIQSCYDYYTRDIGQICLNNLQVSITWYCDPGDGNPQPNSTSAVRATCYHPQTDAAGNPVLNTTGQQITLPYPALPSIYEYWAGCQNYESRVPPGLLLPDGDNAMPPPATGPSVPDKCERTNSVCTAPAQTLFISGIPVAAACWQYTDTYDCLDQNTQSDCNAPWVASCTPQGAPVCVDTDPLNPSTCETWRKDFSCPVTGSAQGTSTVSAGTTSNCSNQTFSDGQGNVWNIGHPPDTSFKNAVTGSEALREAGLTLNTANMTVLAGEDDRCRIALFGVDNCCNSGGTNAFTTLTDRALSAVTAAQIGMDPIRDFSNYTYNALFPGMGNLITDLTIPPSLWSSLQLSLQLSGLINCTGEEKNLALKRDANLCTDIGEYCSEKTPIIHICIQHTHTYCCFNSQLAQAINVQGKAQLGISMGTSENPNCGGLTIAQFQGINLSTMNLSAFQNEISPYGVDASQATAQAIAAGAQSSGTSTTAATAKSMSVKASSMNKAANSDPASEPPCFYGAGKCGQ